MGKKRCRQMWTQHDGYNWREQPFQVSPPIWKAMMDTTPTITCCATCDSRHWTYTMCLLIRRDDVGPDVYEQHIFGVCDTCKDRYNPEELEIILRHRFGPKGG